MTTDLYRFFSMNMISLMSHVIDWLTISKSSLRCDQQPLGDSFLEKTQQQTVFLCLSLNPNVCCIEG